MSQEHFTEGTKKSGSNKIVRCLLLDAREAQLVRMSTSQKSASQCWVKLQSQHHRSADTAQAAMLIWQAVEVKLNGTSRTLVHAGWEGRRGSQRVTVVLGRDVPHQPLLPDSRPEAPRCPIQGLQCRLHLVFDAGPCLLRLSCAEDLPFHMLLRSISFAGPLFKTFAADPSCCAQASGSIAV